MTHHAKPARRKAGAAAPAQTAPPVRPVAVIDVGTTAIRMIVAQAGKSGVRVLESVQQAVSLGKDTFTTGCIGKASTEECVKALKSFKRILNEYKITHPDQIKAVATTAVREATNRDAFIDRIYMATGIHVDVIDEADATRLTYLSVQPYIKSDPALSASHVLIAEVGGGSTEILVIHKGNVVLSNTYRLGALRMRETLETFHAPVVHRRDLMEGNIRRTIEQIKQSLPAGEKLRMIALGGDARFAANQIIPDRNPDKPANLTVNKLASFTEEILSLPVDDIERKYHLPFPEAETAGPALLAYLSLARAFKLDHIVVTNITMRHGLLMEITGSGVWTEDFKEKILWSALETARKFHADEAHARHVAELCKALFRDLQEEHQLGPRHEFLLTLAALLHDIGLFISTRTHHKHSMYLIQNSEVFGVSRNDLALISVIARYHRRASPKPTHIEYMSLDRENRLIVSKLAAILRAADALDLSHSQRIHGISCRREDDRFVVTVPHVDDLSLEQMALKQKGPMFEEVYGGGIVLRKRR